MLDQNGDIVPSGRAISITKDNLQKAYKEGCSDVKKVLDNLFPGQSEEPKKEKKWVDVTDKCIVLPGHDDYVCIHDREWYLYWIYNDGRTRKVGDTPYDYRIRNGRIEREAEC
jgi:hypothetical protein